MKIETIDMHDKHIICLDGKVDTNTAPEFDSALTRLIESGSQQIVADFEKLSFISSAGLRVLLAAAKKLKATQGELVVCAMNPTVAEVFAISGFSTILRVFDDRESALAG